MDKEVKDEWVAALKSGDYKQATGRLSVGVGSDTRHCCLGVLCEIAVKHKVIQPPVIAASGIVGYGQESANAILPWEVAEWAKITAAADLPQLQTLPHKLDDEGYDNPIDCLSQANDSGYTFDEIAEVIEERF